MMLIMKMSIVMIRIISDAKSVNDDDGESDGEVMLMRILLLVFINVTLGGGIVVQGFGDLMRACVTWGEVV